MYALLSSTCKWPPCYHTLILLLLWYNESEMRRVNRWAFCDDQWPSVVPCYPRATPTGSCTSTSGILVWMLAQSLHGQEAADTRCSDRQSMKRFRSASALMRNYISATDIFRYWRLFVMLGFASLRADHIIFEMTESYMFLLLLSVRCIVRSNCS